MIQKESHDKIYAHNQQSQIQHKSAQHNKYQHGQNNQYKNYNKPREPER